MQEALWTWRDWQHFGPSVETNLAFVLRGQASSLMPKFALGMPMSPHLPMDCSPQSNWWFIYNRTQAFALRGDTVAPQASGWT